MINKISNHRLVNWTATVDIGSHLCTSIPYIIYIPSIEHNRDIGLVITISEYEVTI